MSEKSILVADSGSTKANWIYHTINERKDFHSAGINPIYMSDDEISLLLDLQFDDTIKPEEVHFYGAGCMGEYANKLSYVLEYEKSGRTDDPNIEKAIANYMEVNKEGFRGKEDDGTFRHWAIAGYIKNIVFSNK